MITRGENFKAIPLNIVGSSIFGRYPKISVEKTYNMFQSDTFMVPYAGYFIGIPSRIFNNGKQGRSIFSSIKFGKLVVVIDSNVYLVSIDFNQQFHKVTSYTVTSIGQLNTSTGIVYIAENNKPQIGISDGTNFYIYDPATSPTIQVISIDFTPGYLTFHDTYFIMPAVGTNIWRISKGNDGTVWANDQYHVGALETKPDNVQAVVRFPSKGNMIFVMGSIVTEAWFDVGAQTFPYQRQNQFNIDYGCLNPASVAYMDEIVVWLAANEKSGPIILYSDGGMPQKITTDGIDYLFSILQYPEICQGFMYRQDGHLFYHINFYADNLSLFYDFITHKFYHACDQNIDYFIAAEVAFFDNQYYFITRNNGNMFVFDTDISTFQDVDSIGNMYTYDIPRMRYCSNVRNPDQDYLVFNDIGFTIESGETNYVQQETGPIYLVTQDGKMLVSQGDTISLVTQDDISLVTQDLQSLITQSSSDPTPFIAQQMGNTGYGNLSVPRVDLSISIDGGGTFGNEWANYLPGVGHRKNKLMWWQLGVANDFVPLFKFWGTGRFVVTDGQVYVRK